MLVRLTLGLIFISLFTKCADSQPTNSEYSEWKNDSFGCKGDRAKLLSQLEKTRSDFVGKTQDEVLFILGKPDINELQDRSKSSFGYYIEGAEKCGDTMKTATILVLDFNSLNQVRFATLQHW